MNSAFTGLITAFLILVCFMYARLVSFLILKFLNTGNEAALLVTILISCLTVLVPLLFLEGDRHE